MMASELLSLREYARSRKSRGLAGGTLHAVQKAIKSGRIEQLENGRIDRAAADTAWDQISPDARARCLSRQLGVGKLGSLAGGSKHLPAAADAQADVRTDMRLYWHSRAEREQHEAELRRLDVLKRQGELLNAVEVSQAADSHAVGRSARCSQLAE
jgi:hypothetical protein